MSITRSMIFVLLTAITLGSLSTYARADNDAENEALGRLVAELEALQPLILAAEQQADPGKRVTFNYEALRADVRAVQVGIEQFRSGLRSQPREVAPVVGDYRR